MIHHSLRIVFRLRSFLNSFIIILSVLLSKIRIVISNLIVQIITHVHLTSFRRQVIYKIFSFNEGYDKLFPENGSR